MNTFDSFLKDSVKCFYGTPRRRTVFFKAVTAVLAVNMFFMGMPVFALPSGAGSAVTGNAKAWNAGSGTLNWNSYKVAADETVNYTGNSINIVNGGGGTDIQGTINAAGYRFWIFDPAGISIGNGATLNIGSLLAAAMNYSTDTDGKLKIDNLAGVTGGVNAPGRNGIFIGKTVNAAGGTIIATAGMSGTMYVDPVTGGTISFAGVTGNGSAINTSGAIELTGDSTVGGGTIRASEIRGASTMTQTAGEITAAKVAGAVTQSGGTLNATEISGALTQNSGTISAGNGTLTLGAGGTIGGRITAGKIDAGANNLTWKAGNIGTAIDAGTLTIGNSGATAISSDINATTINATGKTVTQNGGAIVTTTLSGNLTQNNGGTVNATTLSGNVTQNNGGVITAGKITGILTQNGGTINAKGGTLTLDAASTVRGAVNADVIDNKTTLTQTAGTITANEIKGVVTQNGGTIRDNGAGLTISQALGTQKGTIDVGANTLTLSEGGTLSGAVNAGKINAAGKDVTQAAGSITVSGTDGLVASKFTQSAGSMSADTVNAEVTQSGNGTISANEIMGAVTQNGGTITAKGDTLTLDSATTIGGTVNASVIDNRAPLTQTAGAITANEIKGVLAQNGGTIKDMNGHGLKLDQAVADGTQKGTLNVSSLELGGDSSANFVLTGNNNIKQLTGSAGTVQLDNGANAVDLKDLTTTALTISKAGSVTDSGSVDLGQLTIGGATSLVLDNTKATVKGVTTSGDVGLVIGSGNVALEGAVAGRNVTLQAAEGEGLTVANGVSATGDLLLKAEGGAVSVSANQSAGGSMVIQGTSVGVANSTLKAGIGVGLAATAVDGSVELSGTSSVNAPDVVVKAGKEITIADTVAMKSKADAAKNDANLVVYVEDEDNGVLDVKLDGTTTENIVIAKAASAPVSAGDTVTLNKFAYKTSGDIDIKFTGSQLSLEGRSIKVDAEAEEVSIFDAAAQASGSGSVKASNVLDGEKVVVGAGTSEADSPHGLVASEGTVAFNGTDTALTLESGTISGTAITLDTKSFEQKAGSITTDGDLAITAANGNVGQSGGKITANAGTATLTAESGNVKLDQAANDFATVDVAARNIALVDANDLTIAAAKASGGNVNVTAGGALDNTGAVEASGDIRLTGASFTGNGTVTSTDNAGNVRIATMGGSLTIGSEVNAKNVTIQSAGAVAENAVVNANGGDKAITAGGAITVAAAAVDFAAQNAIYDAGTAGTVTFNAAPTVDGGSGNLGLRGTEIVVGEDNADIPNVAAGALVIETTQGDVTLASGKPANVDTLSVKAAGNLTVTSDEEVNYGAGNVQATTVTANGTDSRTLAVNGLEAGNDLTITANGADIAMAGATAGGAVSLTAEGGDIDVGTVTAGGATTVKATTVSGGTYNGATVDITADGVANLTAVNAAGAATVNADSTQGGQIQGGTVDVTTTGAMANNVNATAGDANVNAGSIDNGAIAAAGNVTATANNGGNINSGTVTAGGAATLTANDVATTTTTAGGATTVNATTVSGGTYNGATVDITADGVANLTAVNANGQATVNAAQTTGGQIAGGNVIVNVGGGNIANDIQAGGQVTITSGSINNNAITAGALELNTGAVNTGDITVNGLATLNTGDINANTLTAGEVAFNSGAVNTGDITVDGAATGATGDLVFEQFTAGKIDMDTGAVNNHGEIETDDLALRAGGDVDIVLDMGNNGNLAQLTGNDINLDIQLENGVINLGEVNAAGNLVVNAPDIGNGSNAGGGFNDANGGANNLIAQNITLNVGGRVGTLQDPIEVQVNGGTITVNGGNASDPSFVHLSLAGTDGVQFLGDTSYGLVILNHQVVGGNPRLIRLINRAFAFTVNAPEIKSAQGVFGNPAFVHSKMDIVDTRSMGVVDTLSVGRLDYGGMFNKIDMAARRFRNLTPPVNLDEGSTLDTQIRNLKVQTENSMIDIHPSADGVRKIANGEKKDGQK